MPVSLEAPRRSIALADSHHLLTAGHTLLFHSCCLHAEHVRSQWLLGRSQNILLGRDGSAKIADAGMVPTMHSIMVSRI